MLIDVSDLESEGVNVTYNLSKFNEADMRPMLTSQSGARKGHPS